MLALDGYKTYILVTLGVLTILAFSLGYIDANTMMTLLALEGFGSIAALRDAISKIEDHVLPIEVTPEPAAPVATEPVVPMPPAAPTAQDVTNIVTAGFADITAKLNALNNGQPSA